MMTQPTTNKRPNLVLVLCDSMRARNVSSYGYNHPTTPNLDRLASEGVRFQNAFVQAPFTVASTVSLLTGVYPSVHRLEYYGQRLDERLVTLPQILQAAGYYTAGFVANPHVNPNSGLTRGFTYFTDGRPWYKQLPGVKRLATWAESGRALNRRVKEVAPQAHDQPFFFFVFYNDSHIPFSDRPRILLPLAGKKFHSPDFETISYTDEELARVVALYDRALQRADKWLGELYRLIERSPHGTDTIFVISADHGEGLDRRFERAGHGRLYENGIHVPLAIWGPKMAYPGKVVEELTTSLDLAPTICELAGVKVPAQFQGHSLAPYLRNEANMQPCPHVISEYHDSRCVRTKGWKLIQRGAGIGQPIDSRDVAGNVSTEFELYKVDVDPLEEENLAKQYPEIVAKLSHTLRLFVTDSLSRTYQASSFDADEMVIERLRGLGYLK